MAKTVVGLFDDFQQAESAVRDLSNAGFRREDLGITANNAHGRLDQVTEATTHHTGAATGAGLGAVLGGLGGILLGIGALTVPGIGPVLAAGPLATALLGIGVGAVAGGLIGALADLGIPEEEAHYYAEGVRRGGTLVTVVAEDDTARAAADILERHGAIDIERRAAMWRERGWNGYSPNAAPYSPDQITAEREHRVTAPSALSTDSTSSGTVNPMTVPPVSGPMPAQPPLSATGTTGATSAAVPVVPVPAAGAAGGLGAPASGSGTPVIAATSYPGARIYERRDPHAVAGAGAPVVPAASTGLSVPAAERPEWTEHDRDFRSDFATRFGSTGDRYEEFEPAYRYGSELAGSRAPGDEWERVEPEFRRDWEARNAGPWERVRDAVRYGWERARNRTLDRAA